MDSKIVYRYKLAPDLLDKITDFSRLHMYSRREVFKEKWKEWLITNHEIVETEKQRLETLGYKKNINEKMYTSARYYFKNKLKEPVPDPIAQERQERQEKRQYIILDTALITAMDEYIIENYNRQFKPSTAYDEFLQLNNDIIKEEIGRLKSQVTIDSDYKWKIKKTLKNRCYIIEQRQLLTNIRKPTE